LHLNFPVENIDNRVRIMPVDRVDGSWSVIDSNDFNLFTRRFPRLFRKERIHLQGMRCRGKSEGKDKYREESFFMLCIASVLSVMCCDNRLNRSCVADTHSASNPLDRREEEVTRWMKRSVLFGGHT
jgi:hypothetical protein